MFLDRGVKVPSTVPFTVDPEKKSPHGLGHSAGRGDPGVPSIIPFEKGSGRAGIKGTCPPKPPISVLGSSVATEEFDTRKRNKKKQNFQSLFFLSLHKGLPGEAGGHPGE